MAVNAVAASAPKNVFRPARILESYDVNPEDYGLRKSLQFPGVFGKILGPEDAQLRDYKLEAAAGEEKVDMYIGSWNVVEICFSRCLWVGLAGLQKLGYFWY